MSNDINKTGLAKSKEEGSGRRTRRGGGGTPDSSLMEDSVSSNNSNIGPVPITKKARTKRVDPTSMSTRGARLKPQIVKIEIDDPYEKILNSKGVMNLGTGLVFHVSMGNHDCLWDSSYPENPARFYSVLDRCNQLGLLTRCTPIEAREATEEELLRVHLPFHIEFLRKFDGYNEAIILEEISSRFDAIYVHPSTYSVSLLAAGCSLNLIDAICSKKVTNGIAIVRPPGHHAMVSEYNGYCFFNNVALAAKHAIEVFKMSRILIVDWDVHHGQGTQQIFYNDKRVLYFSIHRFEDGSFWPNLAESDLNFVGEGPGKGYNMNVPLNKTGLGNAEYMAIFQHLLLPVAYEFRPELVLVSAGYDAAMGCPEGEMEVTPACYAHLLWSLKGLANGNIAVFLEGGYCLKSLDEGVAMTLRALLGDPCPMMEPLGEPDQIVKDTILRCIGHHYPYWKCFSTEYKVGIDLIADMVGVPTWPYPPPLRLVENVPPFATRNCYPILSPERNSASDNRLEELIKGTNLTFAENRVCYAYETEMASYVDKTPALEIESPLRVTHTHKILKEFGLVQRCRRLRVRVADIANPSELLLAHDLDYVSFLKTTEEMDSDELQDVQQKFNSVILKKTSYLSMRIAVGCLIKVVDEVCSGNSRSGAAVVRPPGHHAEPDHPCGFCLVNNVAIAARHAQQKFHLKRILIVDWDIHHGNGTQHIFYDDPTVLYISLHRYDGGRFFPRGPDGHFDKVGSGNGKGFNVNIPWHGPGMHDGDYIAAFTRVVMPVAYEYNPELVIISAGFDAAINDPLGRCCVTPEAYGHFTNWLSSLANGRIVVALEGGYNIHSVASCMTSCIKSLLNDPLIPIDNVKPSSSGLKAIYETIGVHYKYWKSLRIKNCGANTRQIIDGTHSFARTQFGKDYNLLTANEQLACFRSLLEPTAHCIKESEGMTIISQFLKLGLKGSSFFE